MKRACGWAAGALVLCASSFARAEDGKIKLGIRGGYSGFAGSASGTQLVCAGKVCGSTADPGDVISGQIPIWLDAGYQLTPALLLGAYGQYGFADLKSCSGCSAQDLRVGVQAQYRFGPELPIQPWVGFGIGYESLSLSGFPGFLVDSPRVATTLTGWELANFQAGIDFYFSHTFALGPFVSASVDEFEHSSGNAWHDWITFGAKATLGL